MLHFAYGSNMHRAVMRRHASQAEPLGVACLADHRFVITADGWASVEPARGEVVHGVLWRITPRDRITLDLWENVPAGLYRAHIMPVRTAGRQFPTLIYRGRPRRRGEPRAGYMEVVIAAARAWRLPADYIDSLDRWLPKHPTTSGSRKFGDLAWT